MTTYTEVSNFKVARSFEHIGWKYYNNIKKKAMEQEFSLSGLLISLSIAFFIVIISASGLSLANKSLRASRNLNLLPTNLYIFEGSYDYSLNNYLNKEAINNKKIETLNFSYLS